MSAVEPESLFGSQAPSTLQQLKSTELAYDAALQENIRLLDRTRELEQEIELLQLDKHDVVSRVETRVFPPSIHLSGKEEVKIETVGEVSRATIVPVPPRPGMANIVNVNAKLDPKKMRAEIKKALDGTADVIILDDPIAPSPVDETTLQAWFETATDRSVPASAPATDLTEEERLRTIIRTERRRKKNAIGDRANMKLAVMQSQKANRKHKRRIEKLQAQAETHLELIAVLKPCYSRLLEVLLAATESENHTISVGPTDVAMLNAARVELQEFEASELS